METRCGVSIGQSEKWKFEMSHDYIQLDISLKSNKIYENSHFKLHINSMSKIQKCMGDKLYYRIFFFHVIIHPHFKPMKNSKRILKLKYDMIF
ncbi:hypothetical protein COJ46_05465 [Bacillus sp. AFS077874]|nr:hypothetical protein COJ46_05465 [Bacillus sp. AFS077874]